MAREKQYGGRAWQRKPCGIREQSGVTTPSRRQTLHRYLQVPLPHRLSSAQTSAPSLDPPPLMSELPSPSPIWKQQVGG